MKQRHSSSKTKTAKPKKILYSVGQPDHSSFHFYHCLLNDFDRHLWTKNLLKSIQRNDLSLDVKLHPVEWTVYQEYFNKLLMQEKFNKINLEIIIGGSIERILKNYNLLVLDMVPSQVLSAALSMGMNIILFKQPSNFINKDTYADLINRVYVASNVDELDHLLKLFREKKLKNKSSIEFDEKYLSWNSEIIDILDQAKF